MRERRLVTFAGGTIEVVERDPDAAHLVQFLFGRFPQAPHGAPCVSLALACDGPATFALWRDDSLVYRATAAATAIRLMLAEAAHKFSVNARGGLLMHAAAVECNGAGFLLPGPSGAGKSTLTAWLDFQGFGCLSDEMIGVSEGSRHLVAFPRPICLELDAYSALPAVLDEARREGRLLEGQESLLLVPRSPVPPTPVPLCRVIFPRYTPNAETALRPLSKGIAAIRLLALVARTLPDHGFAAIGNLVRRVPAFELRYGTLDRCGDAILSSLEPGPTRSDE